MVRRIQLQNLIGLLAVGVVLALSWPGVRVSRAAEEAAPVLMSSPLVLAAPAQTEEPLVCEAALAAVHKRDTGLEQLVAAIAERERSRADDSIVVLNSRGFNYQNGPRIGRLPSARELALQR
jgi:hypothetical protein